MKILKVNEKKSSDGGASKQTDTSEDEEYIPPFQRKKKIIEIHGFSNEKSVKHRLDLYLNQLKYFYNNRFECEFGTSGTIAQESVHHTLGNEPAITHGMHCPETLMATVCCVILEKNWNMLNKIPIMPTKNNDKNMLKQSLECALRFYNESHSFQDFQCISTVGMKRKDASYWREKGFGIATGHWKYNKYNLLNDAIDVLKSDIKKAASHGSWLNTLSYWVGMPKESVEYKMLQNHSKDVQILNELWENELMFAFFLFFFL